MPRAPRQRRWGAIAGLMALLAACVVAGMYLWKQAGQTSEIIVVSDSLGPGEVVERSDLASKPMVGVENGFTADQVDQVVGRTTTVGLTAGQVVPQAALVDHPLPGHGQHLVGLALTPSRMPAGLEVGDRVSVLQVPVEGETGAADQLDDPPVLAPSGQVYALTTTPDQLTQVTIVVAEATADRVAAYGAAGQVAVQEIAQVSP